jgi:hypothetical protein
VYRSVFTNLFFFVTIGLAGYFSTYENTGSIVIERLPPGGGEGVDILMTVGQLMIIVVLCIAYSINTVPMKAIFLQNLYHRKHEMTTK